MPRHSRSEASALTGNVCRLRSGKVRGRTPRKDRAEVARAPLGHGANPAAAPFVVSGLDVVGARAIGEDGSGLRASSAKPR